MDPVRSREVWSDRTGPGGGGPSPNQNKFLSDPEGPRDTRVLLIYVICYPTSTTELGLPLRLHEPPVDSSGSGSPQRFVRSVDGVGPLALRAPRASDGWPTSRRTLRVALSSRAGPPAGSQSGGVTGSGEVVHLPDSPGDPDPHPSSSSGPPLPEQPALFPSPHLPSAPSLLSPRLRWTGTVPLRSRGDVPRAGRRSTGDSGRPETRGSRGPRGGGPTTQDRLGGTTLG